MALTAYKRQISKAVTGNLQLFVIKKRDVTAIAIDNDGNVATFDIDNGYEIQGDVDSVQFTNEGKAGIYGTTYIQKMIVKMLIGKQELIDLQAELNDTIGNGICLIRTDGNKNCFLSGYGTDVNDADLESDDRLYRMFETKYDSGSATNEDGKQTVEITFTANLIQNELRFDTTITTAIIDGTYTNLNYA